MAWKRLGANLTGWKHLGRWRFLHLDAGEHRFDLTLGAWRTVSDHNLVAHVVLEGALLPGMSNRAKVVDLPDVG